MPTDTDRHWKRIGETEPYWGVATQPQFAAGRLDDQARAEFFATGEQHLDRILETIQQQLVPGFHPARCLDFGCGVGRVLVPMARRFEVVVGVDVSPAMLAEARANCARAELTNVDLVESDDGLSRVQGPFDLIHSAMVFQHLALGRGERYLRRLMALSGAGGVAALHFTYHWPVGRLRRFKYWLLTHAPLAPAAANVLRGRPATAPLMEMNSYNLNRLFAAVQAAGVRELHASFTQHHEHWGVLLFFQKPPGA